MLGLYALICDRRARSGARHAAGGTPRVIRVVIRAIRLVPFVFAATFAAVAVGFAIAGETTRALLAALVVVFASSVAIRVELLLRR